MRVYKAVYRDRHTGKKCKSEKWYVELWDPRKRKVRRLPLFVDKGASLEFARKLHRLQGYRASDSSPDREIREWIQRLPDELASRLLRLDLIDTPAVAGNAAITGQIIEYENHLRAKGRCPRHIKWTISQISNVIDGCGFRTWADIQAERIENYLSDIRERDELKTRSINGYTVAVKSFATWAVRSGRISFSPLERLATLTITDKREYRAFTLDELRWLLTVTAAESERFGMSGLERALLYRLAVETGFRAGELQSLHVSSFHLDDKSPFVEIVAAKSKNRKSAAIDISTGLAGLLAIHFRHKLPAATAFNVPDFTHTAEMLRADLTIARSKWLLAAQNARDAQKRTESEFLAETDGADRVLVFHSFRHTRGVWLFEYQGASPREVQELMRVGSIALVDRYTRSFQVHGRRIADRAPDLSIAKVPVARATG